MAVTILSQPGTHTPAYNNQFFVCSSGNTNQTNFRYVATVTLGTDTIIEKINKRPDNGDLYFDPSSIVKSYVDNTFSRSSLNFAPQDDSIIYVTVGIGEEYGSPVSGFAATSGTYYAWNAAYNTHDFQSYTYAATSIAKDLTLAPSYTDTINFNQKYLLKTWHRGFSTRNIRYLTIDSYDSSGVSVQSAVIENAYYNVGPYKNNMITLNCSPYGFNGFDGTIVSKTFAGDDVIPATTSYYILSFSSALPPGVGNISSNTYTVNIDTMCYKYDRYVLHFLNRLGNYDCFTFNLLSRNTSDKKTQEYKKSPFERVGTDYLYYNDTGDTLNYNTTITNKMVLNSDWISDAEATWLKDLFMSPDVKLEDASGNLYAVKVTDTSYESKLKVNDKVFNLTVNIEYTYQDIRQRG